MARSRFARIPFPHKRRAAMHGATEDALRAAVAAAATERLAARALEEVLDTTEFTPEWGLLLDTFTTCAMAVARVTRSILAGTMPGAPTCDLVLTALSRMNNNCWWKTSGDQYARHFLMLDVAERLLVDLVARMTEGTAGKGRQRRRKPRGSVAAEAHARSLIEAVLALAGRDPLLATHLLVGVTIRALSGICLGPRAAA